MKLPREALMDLLGDGPRFDLDPIQLGMPTPWHIVIVSMMRQSGKKFLSTLAERIFYYWPTATRLARATEEQVTAVLVRGSLPSRLARRMIAFSKKWVGEWRDLRDLPGVGMYEADCVSLFCFGCREIVSQDTELLAFVKALEEEESEQPRKIN